MNRPIKWADGVLREYNDEELEQHEKDLVEQQARKRVDVRVMRNALLSETDWTQAADISQATKDKWAPYRQALRDVPQQAGFPENIQWPAQPE